MTPSVLGPVKSTGSRAGIDAIATRDLAADDRCFVARSALQQPWCAARQVVFNAGATERDAIQVNYIKVSA